MARRTSPTSPTSTDTDDGPDEGAQEPDEGAQGPRKGDAPVTTDASPESTATRRHRALMRPGLR